MKKRTTLLYTLFATITLIALFTNQYVAPDNGYTGAPGEGTCADCHSPANANFTGQVQITGIPDQLFAGQEYKLNIEVHKFRGNPAYAGFQMVVLDQNNQDIGTLNQPTGVSGIITDRNLLRTYFKNVIHPTDFGPDSVVTWSVTWVAPEDKTNATINFYATAILANGDSTALGDLAVKTQLSRILTEGGPLSVEIANVTNVQCGGDSTGAISLLVQGGTAPLAYQWSNGASTPDIQSLPAGSYTVTVTDSDTSQVIKSVTITEPAVLTPQVISTTGVACNGQDNGTAILGASGGTPPYQFLWPDADTSRVRTNLAAGDYIVLVVDQAGCAGTIALNIEANVFIQTNAGSVAESTPGAQDGIAYVAPSGGTPPYLIVWNTGANTDTIRQLAPGTYTVVIGDLSGCLVQDSVVVGSGTCPLEGNTNADQPDCASGNAGSITVSFPNPTGQVSILWSTGDTTPTIQDLAPGAYFIFAEDEATCTFRDTVVIQSTGMISLDSVRLNHPQCDGTNDGSITFTINGGVPPYRLDWTPDLPSSTPDSLAAGTYILTIFDSNNCTSKDTFELLGDDNTLPFILSPSIEAYLNDDGQARVSYDQLTQSVVDNCGMDTITLSRNAFTCTDLGSLQVALTAKDLAGNTLNDSVTIIILDTLNPVIEPFDTLFANRCTGLNYPQILTRDNCGVDTVFLLQGTGPDGSFAVGMNFDIYQAIDFSGNPSLGILPVYIQRPAVYTNLTLPSCSGRSDGQIVIDFPDANTPISTIWGNGQTGDTLRNIPGGSYIAFSADTTGCFFRDTVLLGSSSFQVLLDSIVSESPGGGYLEVHLEGGTEPYEFQWFREDNALADTTLALDSLEAGRYHMKAQDDTGCKITSDDYLISGTTARQNWLTQNIVVYPNPTNGKLWIRNDPHIMIQEISLTNLLGQRIKQWSHPILPIDFSGISGSYLLKINTDQGTVIKHILLLKP